MTAVAFSTSASAGHIPLRVLVIEDSDADAELLIATLERGGYDPSWKRVDTAAELEVAL